MSPGRIALLAFALAAGCDRDSGLPGAMPDIAARSFDMPGPVDGPTGDLAMPDLTPPITLCQGTKLAGTCVQSFFNDAMRCFQTAGACFYNLTGYMQYQTCWKNGAKKLETQGMTTWLVNGRTCLTLVNDFNGTTFTAGGATLRFNGAMVICPDGSTVPNVNPNDVFYGCPELQAFLVPNPDVGCTFDNTMMCR
jgi:hypothetical protein